MLYVVDSDDNGRAVRTGESDGAVSNGGGANELGIGVSLEMEIAEVAGDGEAGAQARVQTAEATYQKAADITLATTEDVDALFA